MFEFPQYVLVKLVLNKEEIISVNFYSFFGNNLRPENDKKKFFIAKKIKDWNDSWEQYFPSGFQKYLFIFLKIMWIRDSRWKRKKLNNWKKSLWRKKTIYHSLTCKQHTVQWLFVQRNNLFRYIAMPAEPYKFLKTMTTAKLYNFINELLVHGFPKSKTNNSTKQSYDFGTIFKK